MGLFDPVDPSDSMNLASDVVKGVTDPTPSSGYFEDLRTDSGNYLLDWGADAVNTVDKMAKGLGDIVGLGKDLISSSAEHVFQNEDETLGIKDWDRFNKMTEGISVKDDNQKRQTYMDMMSQGIIGQDFFDKQKALANKEKDPEKKELSEKMQETSKVYDDKMTEVLKPILEDDSISRLQRKMIHEGNNQFKQEYDALIANIYGVDKSIGFDKDAWIKKAQDRFLTNQATFMSAWAKNVARGFSDQDAYDIALQTNKEQAADLNAFSQEFYNESNAKSQEYFLSHSGFKPTEMFNFLTGATNVIGKIYNDYIEQPMESGKQKLIGGYDIAEELANTGIIDENASMIDKGLGSLKWIGKELIDGSPSIVPIVASIVASSYVPSVGVATAETEAAALAARGIPISKGLFNMKTLGGAKAMTIVSDMAQDLFLINPAIEAAIGKPTTYEDTLLNIPFNVMVGLMHRVPTEMVNDAFGKFHENFDSTNPIDFKEYGITQRELNMLNAGNTDAAQVSFYDRMMHKDSSNIIDATNTIPEVQAKITKLHMDVASLHDSMKKDDVSLRDKTKTFLASQGTKDLSDDELQKRVSSYLNVSDSVDEMAKVNAPNEVLAKNVSQTIKEIMKSGLATPEEVDDIMTRAIAQSAKDSGENMDNLGNLSKFLIGIPHDEDALLAMKGTIDEAKAKNGIHLIMQNAGEIIVNEKRNGIIQGTQMGRYVSTASGLVDTVSKKLLTEADTATLKRDEGFGFGKDANKDSSFVSINDSLGNITDTDDIVTSVFGTVDAKGHEEVTKILKSSGYDTTTMSPTQIANNMKSDLDLFRRRKDISTITQKEYDLLRILSGREEYVQGEKTLANGIISSLYKKDPKINLYRLDVKHVNVDEALKRLKNKMGSSSKELVDEAKNIKMSDSVAGYIQEGDIKTFYKNLEDTYKPKYGDKFVLTLDMLRNHLNSLVGATDEYVYFRNEYGDIGRLHLGTKVNGKFDPKTGGELKYLNMEDLTKGERYPYSVEDKDGNQIPFGRFHTKKYNLSPDEVMESIRKIEASGKGLDHIYDGGSLGIKSQGKDKIVGFQGEKYQIGTTTLTALDAGKIFVNGKNGMTIEQMKSDVAYWKKKFQWLGVEIDEEGLGKIVSTKDGYQALAKYNSGRITVYDIRHGTLAHEMGHAYMDMAMSTAQKEELFKVVSERFNITLDKCEEFIADEISKHLEGDRRLYDSLSDSLKGLFGRIIDVVLGLFKRKDIYDEMIYSIRRNKKMFDGYEGVVSKTEIISRKTTTKFMRKLVSEFDDRKKTLQLKYDSEYTKALNKYEASRSSGSERRVPERNIAYDPIISRQDLINRMNDKSLSTAEKGFIKYALNELIASDGKEFRMSHVISELDRRIFAFNRAIVIGKYDKSKFRSSISFDTVYEYNYVTNGGKHFQEQSTKYISHTEEHLVDGGETLLVNEIQSDLFQDLETYIDAFLGPDPINITRAPGQNRNVFDDDGKFEEFIDDVPDEFLSDIELKLISDLQSEDLTSLEKIQLFKTFLDSNESVEPDILFAFLSVSKDVDLISEIFKHIEFDGLDLLGKDSNMIRYNLGTSDWYVVRKLMRAIDNITPITGDTLYQFLNNHEYIHPLVLSDIINVFEDRFDKLQLRNISLRLGNNVLKKGVIESLYDTLSEKEKVKMLTDSEVSGIPMLMDSDLYAFIFHKIYLDKNIILGDNIDLISKSPNAIFMETVEFRVLNKAYVMNNVTPLVEHHKKTWHIQTINTLFSQKNKEFLLGESSASKLAFLFPDDYAKSQWGHDTAMEIINDYKYSKGELSLDDVIRSKTIGEDSDERFYNTADIAAFKERVSSAWKKEIGEEKLSTLSESEKKQKTEAAFRKNFPYDDRLSIYKRYREEIFPYIESFAQEKGLDVSKTVHGKNNYNTLSVDISSKDIGAPDMFKKGEKIVPKEPILSKQERQVNEYFLHTDKAKDKVFGPNATEQDKLRIKMNVFSAIEPLFRDTALQDMLKTAFPKEGERRDFLNALADNRLHAAGFNFTIRDLYFSGAQDISDVLGKLSEIENVTERQQLWESCAAIFKDHHSEAIVDMIYEKAIGKTGLESTGIIQNMYDALLGTESTFGKLAEEYVSNKFGRSDNLSHEWIMGKIFSGMRKASEGKFDFDEFKKIIEVTAKEQKQNRKEYAALKMAVAVKKPKMTIVDFNNAYPNIDDRIKELDESYSILKTRNENATSFIRKMNTTSPTIDKELARKDDATFLKMWNSTKSTLDILRKSEKALFDSMKGKDDVTAFISLIAFRNKTFDIMMESNQDYPELRKYIMRSIFSDYFNNDDLISAFRELRSMNDTVSSVSFKDLKDIMMRFPTRDMIQPTDIERTIMRADRIPKEVSYVDEDKSQKVVSGNIVGMSSYVYMNKMYSSTARMMEETRKILAEGKDSTKIYDYLSQEYKINPTTKLRDYTDTISTDMLIECLKQISAMNEPFAYALERLSRSTGYSNVKWKDVAITEGLADRYIDSVLSYIPNTYVMDLEDMKMIENMYEKSSNIDDFMYEMSIDITDSESFQILKSAILFGLIPKKDVLDSRMIATRLMPLDVHMMKEHTMNTAIAILGGKLPTLEQLKQINDDIKKIYPYSMASSKFRNDESLYAYYRILGNRTLIGDVSFTEFRSILQKSKSERGENLYDSLMQIIGRASKYDQPMEITGVHSALRGMTSDISKLMPEPMRLEKTDMIDELPLAEFDDEGNIILDSEMHDMLSDNTMIDIVNELNTTYSDILERQAKMLELKISDFAQGEPENIPFNAMLKYTSSLGGIVTEGRFTNKERSLMLNDIHSALKKKYQLEAVNKIVDKTEYFNPDTKVFEPWAHSNIKEGYINGLEGISFRKLESSPTGNTIKEVGIRFDKGESPANKLMDTISAIANGLRTSLDEITHSEGVKTLREVISISHSEKTFSDAYSSTKLIMHPLIQSAIEELYKLRKDESIIKSRYSDFALINAMEYYSGSANRIVKSMSDKMASGKSLSQGETSLYFKAAEIYNTTSSFLVDYKGFLGIGQSKTYYEKSLHSILNEMYSSDIRKAMNLKGDIVITDISMISPIKTVKVTEDDMVQEIQSIGTGLKKYDPSELNDFEAAMYSVKSNMEDIDVVFDIASGDKMFNVKVEGGNMTISEYGLKVNPDPTTIKLNDLEAKKLDVHQKKAVCSTNP